MQVSRTWWKHTVVFFRISLSDVQPRHWKLTLMSFFSLSFFQDGLKTADKMKQYIEKLAADLYNVSKTSAVLYCFITPGSSLYGFFFGCYFSTVPKRISSKASCVVAQRLKVVFYCANWKQYVERLHERAFFKSWGFITVSQMFFGKAAERSERFAHCNVPKPCFQIKQTQDEEKKQLTALRDLIKSSLQLDQKEVGTLLVGFPKGTF